MRYAPTFVGLPNRPESLGDLWTPDAVMPDQLPHGHALTGEQRLALAVLRHAFRTLIEKPRTDEDWTQTYKWAMRNDQIYAFDLLCDVLRLDADVMRSYIYQLRGKSPRSFRHEDDDE